MRRVALLIPCAAVLIISVPAHAYWFLHQNYSMDPTVSKEEYRSAPDGSFPSPGNMPAPIVMEVLPLPPGVDPAVVEAVTRAVGNWSRVSGSGLTLAVKGPAAGAAYDNNWTSRYNAADGRNTIEFVPQGWPWFWGPDVIAMTVPHTDDQGRIKEADIFCNGQNFTWSVFSREGYFPALDALGVIDTESLITHEMGHVFGLGHSQYAWAAMYEYPGVGDTRSRHLTSDDRAGLKLLYPLAAADTSPPSIWGIHADTWGGDCGMSTLDFNGAKIAYFDRGTPLAGPHMIIHNPPLAGDTVWPYCLMGAGFRPERFTGMDLYQNGAALATVTDASYVGPNFVKATLVQGAGAYPALAAGSYDAGVEQTPGGVGALEQGVIVNDPANGVPTAVAEGPAQARPGVWVRVDGSGSSDPDGDPLTYHWSVPESPLGAPAVLASDTATVTSVYMPREGTYVVRLVVNDGVTDGVASDVVIRSRMVPRSGDDGKGPFGCSTSGNVPLPASLPAIILPLAAAALVKKRLAARRVARASAPAFPPTPRP